VSRALGMSRVASAALVMLAAACAPSASPVAPATTVAAGGPLGQPSIVVTPEMGAPHVGDVAPPLELADRDGKKVSLASLRGSVVLLAFVASFCPFSEAEQPYLKVLADDYRDKNVMVVAVDVKEDDASYAKYLARMPMPFPVLWDKTGEVTASFAPPGAQPALADRSMVLVTSNLVLDEQGTIRFFTMVDTVHFDAKLVHARAAIDRLLDHRGT
jgi:peroxiredoxin